MKIQQDLIFAIGENNLSELRRLIEDKGADINYVSEAWGAPLFIACTWDHEDIIDYLLKRSDVDIELKSTKGTTAVHAASHLGNLESVIRLLEHNASVNSVSSEGITPLYAAALSGHNSIVRFLLKRGANPDVILNTGIPALEMVERKGLHVTANLIKRFKLKSQSTCVTQAKFQSIEASYENELKERETELNAEKKKLAGLEKRLKSAEQLEKKYLITDKEQKKCLERQQKKRNEHEGLKAAYKTIEEEIQSLLDQITQLEHEDIAQDQTIDLLKNDAAHRHCRSDSTHTVFLSDEIAADEPDALVSPDQIREMLSVRYKIALAKQEEQDDFRKKVPVFASQSLASNGGLFASQKSTKPVNFVDAPAVCLTTSRETGIRK